MNLTEIQNIQAVDQITNDHIQVMNDLLSNNQRAEVYLYYAKLIGDKDPSAVTQLMEQAQITTYSGVMGGAALSGNFNAKQNASDDYNLTLDSFSADIIHGMISEIEGRVTKNESGLLTANQIQAADQKVWADKNMLEWFPGNYQKSWDVTDGSILSNTNNLQDILNLINSSLGISLGKREGEFKNSDYKKYEDNGITYYTNKETQKVEGVFPDNGIEGLLNSILGEDPSFTSKLLRDELQKYMGADGKDGPSMYDYYDQFNNGDITEEQLKENVLAYMENARLSDTTSYEFSPIEYNLDHNSLRSIMKEELEKKLQQSLTDEGYDALMTTVLTVPDTESGNYVIKQGDSLSVIADKYGITVDDLISLNPWLSSENRISDDGNHVLIKPGETLSLPNQDANNMGTEDPLNLGHQTFGAAVADSIPKDPLIIDVNGDGLQLSSWQNSNVRFDMSGDGVAERTGWTQASSANISYDGGDIIIDANSANLIDQIELGSGISKEDLTFSQVSVLEGSDLDYDLVITFNNNSNDSITIVNYFRNPDNYNGNQVQIAPYQINGLKFDDGSSFDFSDLKYQVNGTDGNDRLYAEGDEIDDSVETFINAGAGDDSIYGKDLVANGGDGDDFFSVNGNFKISAGSGDDEIRSGSSNVIGNNEVFTGDGNDNIRLVGGSNFVSSGRGNDFISLTSYYNAVGNHVVYSGSGADYINLGSGDDVINAGSGDDIINVGEGNNIITGGSGADFFNLDASPADEASIDIITDFELNSGDKVDFGVATSESFADLNLYQDGDDAVIEMNNKKVILENIDYLELTQDHFNGLVKIVDIYGGKLDDFIRSEHVGNFYGGAGNDEIWATNSTLDGGEGNDVLMGSNNILTGGIGDDKFLFTGSGNNVITDFDVNNLNEKIVIQDSSISSFDELLITDSEFGAVITYNKDEQYSTEITLSNVLASQISADNFDIQKTISGTVEDDIITLTDDNSYNIGGNGGNDVVVTAGGDDKIYLGNGDHDVTSGAGDDEINIFDGGGNVNAQEGDDYIKVFSLETYDLNILGGDGNDYIDIDIGFSSYYSASKKIFGENGDDTIDIESGIGLEIYGGLGNDNIIYSSLGGSVIFANEGDDKIILESDSTSNEVFAGSGDDLITMLSGTSNNIISGDEGNDIFAIKGDKIFSSSNIITDFEVNNLHEKIDFQFINIDRFEDLLISQEGNNAVIIFNSAGGNISLQNIDIAELSADNFLFKNVGSEENDVINAHNHINNVDAGLGNDIISILGKDNQVSGGAGNDMFIIQKNANSATVINDFSAFSAYEKIQLKGFDDISFSDLMIVYSLTSSIDDTRIYNAKINLGDGQTLEIKNVPDQSLTADEFLFTELTEAELTEFNNSLEAEMPNVAIDVIEEIADNESHNKIYSESQNTTYIQIIADPQTRSTGTTASVTPQINDDVFLVLDKNNNGEVDDVSELFGNDEKAGFEELSLYDSNADLIINSEDSQYDLLKFWNDSNANAVVDAGELTTLSENGVEEISLRTISNGSTLSGNFINRTAEIKFDNGNVGVVNEVFFGVSNFDSALSDPDEALGPNFALSFDALNLPFSRGFGGLHSWQVAMSLDNELLDIAQTLNDLGPNELGQIDSLFETFLYQWAGLEDVDSEAVYSAESGREIKVNQITFLEKITGLDFVTATNASVSQANQSWGLFYNAFLTRFLTQGTFKEIFPDAHYDLATDVTSLNLTLDEAISNILSAASELDSNSFLTYVHYAKNILQLNRDQFDDANFNAKVDGMVEDVIDSVTISDFDFDGILNIASGDNLDIFGSDNSDILKGGNSSDDVYAGSGNDYIEGGSGNDYLRGEGGNDIYKFNLGDGQNVIDETSGTDKIILGEGITKTSLTFIQVGNDLIINIGDAGDQIGIKNFYSSTQNKVENLEFADGDTIDLANIGNITYGSIQDDVITGSNGNDIIYAIEGDDVIDAGLGDDTIDGGAGDDMITDISGGNDSYIFNSGDGSDIIEDFNGDDVIIFGEGIVQGDITFISDVANNDSLIVKIGDSGDQISLKNFFSSASNASKIETLQFANGSVIDLSNGLEINGTDVSGETLKGTSFADIITGNIGDDVINADSGDDIVTGGEGDDVITDISGGNDSYIFNIGDGSDSIEDFNGNDVIIFGEGISKDDITLIPDVANNNSLIVKIGDNGDQITLKSFFSYASNYSKIETLQFADGSVIDLSNGLEINGANISGETLKGTSSADIITGNIGSDIINAGSGNDIVSGSTGDDIITDTSGGNDSYIFNSGDGSDIIEDFNGEDVIIFGEGILQESITLIPDVANNDSLIIKIGNNGDQITLKRFFSSEDNYSKIETLQFADGSVMDLGNGLEINGSNVSGETLKGTSSADIMMGNIGNDIINAGNGDDIVIGGAGDDVMTDTSGGNDSYTFNIGDGSDIIEDFNGEDVIIFGEGILQENITLIPDVANNDSLIIKVGDNGDQITLKSFFSYSSNYSKIETLQFADGLLMDLSNGLELNGTNISGETLKGTASADIITGNIGDDTINAGNGNDIVTGGAGDDVITDTSGANDSYIFNLGDGSDIIEDFGGEDVIIFGEGIAQEDITLIPDVSNQNSLIIKIGDNGEQITLQSFFSSSDNHTKIETLQFADGSVMDLGNGLAINGANIAGETLKGTSLADVITGNIGDDIINAGSGDDIVSGGKGNDVIIDSLGGHDSYIFNLGDGSDSITDYVGDDTIIFGDGVTIEDIEMESLGVDLIIKVGTLGDQITIKEFFNGIKIENLAFADGTIVRIDEGIDISGSSFNDQIIATPFDDILQGNAGNDYIYAGDGDDMIDGGEGNDSLRGGDGSDSYIFNGNDGNDVVYDNGGSADTIFFGPEIDPAQISAMKNGNHLTIFKQGSGDIINVSNFFTSNSNRIEYVEFDNGAKFNLANIINSSSNLSYSFSGYAKANEDIPTTIKLFNPEDQSGGYLNITSFSGALNGMVSFNDAGEVVYTSNVNFNGDDSFEVFYLDAQNNQQSQIINIDVLAVNDAPIASDFNIELHEDSSAEINPLLSATDIDGDNLTIHSFVKPTHGSVRIDGDKIIYTPNANFNGIDSFEYSVSDGNGGTDTKEISLNVLAINDAPIANNDNVTTDENQAVSIDITNNDYDVETGFFDASLIQIVDAPNSGTVEVQENGKIHYIPDSDYYGLDSFSYVISDLEGLTSNVATVSINVEMVNSAPKQIAGTIISTAEDVTKTFDISEYFYDREGDVIELVSASVAHGSIQISGNQITYLTKQDFFGSDAMNLTIRDSKGALATIVSEITVNPVNDAPDAQDDNFSLLEDTSIRLAVLNNDYDAEDVLFASNIANVTSPLHGIVSINQADGSLFYTPDSNYYGTDIFSYSVIDSEGLSSTATVNLTINSVNDAPDAQDDSFSLLEDSSIILDILNNDYDVEDALFVNNITNITSPLHGTVSIHQLDGTLLYNTDSNYHGTDIFSYTIIDSEGLSSTATVNLTINSVNDAPIILNPISNQNAQENSLFTYVIPAELFSDADGDNLTINITQADGSFLPTWLTFDSATNILSGTPTNVISDKTLSLMITATDQDNASISQNFTIDVMNKVPTDQEIYGGGGDDRIEGADGDDDLRGRSGDDILYGEAGDDTLRGNDGDDILNGGLGFDFLIGGDGIDELNGGQGNDTLNGNDGADILNGDEGNDFIRGGSGDDELNGGLGNDSLYGGNGNNILNGGQGDDFLSGINGNDLLNGDEGNDILKGGGGRDKLKGGSGNDTLLGENGRDYLGGGQGNDNLNGGNGNDVLLGGKGKDFLVGGQGRDIFDFNHLTDSEAGSADMIHDFGQNQDVIDISDLEFTNITHDHSQTDDSVLTYRHSGKNTIIENEDQTFQIELKGVFNLSFGDFDFG